MAADQLATLQRDVRWLKWYAAGMTLLASVLVLTGARDPGKETTFDTIRAERIDIVDADGKTRMLLAGPQRMPGPKGPHDYTKGSRNHVPGGIVLYDETGREKGGMITAPQDDQKLSAVLLDYETTEAIGIYKRQAANGGDGHAAFFINDPAPIGFDKPSNHDWSRITLRNPDRNAEVVLNDTKGKPRIQLRVTKDDQAFIEVLDANGKVAFRAPEAVAKEANAKPADKR